MRALEAPAVFTVNVKSELSELKETVISSLPMITNVVYSPVENNKKCLEMVIIVKYLLTSRLLFFIFFLLRQALPPHPIPAPDQISTHSQRHTIEWKTGQTTRFCVFVFPKPKSLGKEMLYSHPEEAGMERLLCALRFPGLGECERGGGLGPVPRAQLCPAFRSH